MSFEFNLINNRIKFLHTNIFTIVFMKFIILNALGKIKMHTRY